MTLEEIAQEISDKQNELKKQIAYKEVVELQESALAREILQKRIDQKLLNDAILKAGNNIKGLHIEIKQLTNQYWDKKNV